MLTGESYAFCGLYESKMGEFDKIMPEINPESVGFYSARQMDGKPEYGTMESAEESAENWFDEVFGNSAIQMIATIASLASVAAINA